MVLLIANMAIARDLISAFGPLTHAVSGSENWMLKQLVEKGRSKSKWVSPGQQQLPFAFNIRLNQIPDDWQKIAVKFRRANGIRDSDKERSIW